MAKPSFGVLLEHECPRCGRAVELPFGALCPECRREIERRARRIARWVALGSTLVVALYVVRAMPADPTARLVGAIATVVWYLLSTMVVRRVLRQWQR